MVVAQQAPLELDLEGRIDARCEMSPLGSGTGPVDLSVGGSQAFNLDIDCNLPMRVTLSSTNGALVNQQLARLEESGNGWSARKPYQATLVIDGIGFAETVDSDALTAGVVFTTGSDIPFKTRGELRVDALNDGGRYAAGEYVDVIKVTVSADANAAGV